MDQSGILQISDALLNSSVNILCVVTTTLNVLFINGATGVRTGIKARRSASDTDGSHMESPVSTAASGEPPAETAGVVPFDGFKVDMNCAIDDGRGRRDTGLVAPHACSLSDWKNRAKRSFSEL